MAVRITSTRCRTAALERFVKAAWSSPQRFAMRGFELVGSIQRPYSADTMNTTDCVTNEIAAVEHADCREPQHSVLALLSVGDQFRPRDVVHAHRRTATSPLTRSS